MARMRKYGESKTTRIITATVPHVTSGLGLRKFQSDGFLLTRVYKTLPVEGTNPIPPKNIATLQPTPFPRSSSTILRLRYQSGMLAGFLPFNPTPRAVQHKKFKRLPLSFGRNSYITQSFKKIIPTRTIDLLSPTFLFVTFSTAFLYTQTTTLKKCASYYACQFRIL